MAKSNSQKQSNDANLGLRNADSLRADLLSGLKADFLPVRKDFAKSVSDLIPSNWPG